MVLNCLLNSLGFDADVPLCGGCAAVLQQPLYKSNIVAVVLVYLRCVPLAETVGADILIAQVVAYDCKLLLDGPLCYGEDALRAPDAIAQTVVFDVLLNHKGNGENALLACFLFGDRKPEASAAPGPTVITWV